MAKKKYEEANIQAIADTIREKTGTEKTYKTKDMAESVGEVFEAGKQAEYDAFWDAYQNYGKGYWGSFLFYGEWWNDATFYPKYDIKPGGGNSGNVFQSNNVSNLRERINGRGLKIIIPKNNVLHQFFRDCKTKELPIFDTSPAQNFQNFCYQAYNLETVTDLDLTNATNTTDMFYKTTALKNISFVGTIPISLNFQHSPLSPASLKSVVKHLKNYSGIADHTQTLTVKASAWEALEAEGLNDEDKAWLISLMPYVEEDIDYVTWATVVDFFSWNLVLA